MGWLHDFLALLRKPMSWSEFVWGKETFSFQNSDLWWTLPFYHSSSISNCGPLWQNKLTFFKVQRNSFIKSFKHLDRGSGNPTTAYHRPRWLCTAARLSWMVKQYFFSFFRVAYTCNPVNAELLWSGDKRRDRYIGLDYHGWSSNMFFIFFFFFTTSSLHFGIIAFSIQPSP